MLTFEVIMHTLKQMNRPEPWHDRRYVLALMELIKNGLTENSEVLEVGGMSTFTELLTKLVGCDVAYTEHDLREEYDMQDEYDFVLCMETIEHIGEAQSGRRADWAYSGALNCLKTCYDGCKEGGVLFLSTPNVCGPANLLRLIDMFHPFSFQPHTHEYAPKEVAALVLQSGFTVKDMRTVDCWNAHGMPKAKRQWLMKLLRDAGAAIDMREDCIFLTAIK